MKNPSKFLERAVICLCVCSTNLQANSLEFDYAESLASFKEKYFERRNQGFSLRAAGVGGHPDSKFSSILIWDKAGTAAQVLKEYNSYQDFEAGVADQSNAGRCPKTLLAYGSGSLGKYLVIFEDQSDKKMCSSKNLKQAGSGDDSLEGFTKKQGLVQRISMAVQSPGSSSTYVSVVVSNYSRRDTWKAYTKLTEEEVRSYSAIYRAHGVQLESVMAEEDGLFTAIFSDRNDSSSLAVFYNSKEDFEKGIKLHQQRGMHVESVDTSRSFQDPKFKIVALLRSSLKREDKAFSEDGKSLNSTLETKLRSWAMYTLANSGSKTLSIAITKGRALVAAKTFNLSYSKDRKANSNSPYRIASLSKPITAIALMQLKQSNKLSWDEFLLNVLPYKDLGGRPFGPQLQTIKIRDLVGHAGGWDRSIVPDMPDQNLVSKLFKTPLPISSVDWLRYKLREGVEFAPGSAIHYSNMGYVALGRVIEKKSGQTYANYAQANIFNPLKIKASLQGNTVNELLPNEALYTDPDLRLRESVLGANQNKTLIDFGGEHNALSLDSAGSWRMRAVDYARLLSEIHWLRNLGFGGTILTGKSTVELLSPPAPQLSTEVLHGFQREKIDGIDCVGHGGLLPGLVASSCLRDDGLAFVVLMSKGINMMGQAQLMPLVDELKQEPIRGDLFKDYGL